MTNVQVTEDAVTVVATSDPVQVKAGGQAAVDAHNEDAAAHPDLAALSGDVVVVKHAADSTVARPSGANVVHWYGTVAPGNAATDDVWVDNTNDAPRLLRFDGTAFDEIGSASSSAQVEAIIKSGTASVADNVLPPGLRIPEAYTVEQAYVRLGTAPTGADFIVEFNKNGTLFATVTVPAGVASGSVTGLSVPFVAGDVLTWDITQVGSTTAGSDVAAAVFGTLG